MKLSILTLGVIMFLFACGSQEKDSTMETVDNALNLALQQSLLMAETLADMPGRLPKTIGTDGQLETCDPSWWVSGFFPGQLWYMYEYTNSNEIREWAEHFTARVYDQQYNTGIHDVGFMIYCSYGNGYRLTGNEDYLPVIKNASNSLSTRFDSVIGCIQSWDRAEWNSQWQYAVIIDNMMNLEMLEWASRKFDEPKFAEIARTHAHVTMKHHFRDDYSCYHVVSYDTITGQPELYHTEQGYAHHTAWARGQAWALYGYVMMYRETGIKAYLDHSVNIADFLLNHPNLPEDKIPYWDFNAPDIPSAYRDASAGAIICSALLELHQYVNGDKAGRYLDVATQQLISLSNKPYLAEAGTNENFILKHSVGHMPNGTEVNVPLSYADYYFVEALIRYKTLFGK